MSARPRKYDARTLKQHRLSRDMTQTEFGRLIGVSWQQWQKYENGTNRLSVDKAAMLATALGLSGVDALYDGFDHLEGSPNLVLVPKRFKKKKAAKKFKPKS